MNAQNSLSGITASPIDLEVKRRSGTFAGVTEAYSNYRKEQLIREIAYLTMIANTKTSVKWFSNES